MAVSIPDQPGAAAKMRLLWPALAQLSDRHLIQCLLIGAEALLAAAFFVYRAHVIYYDTLFHGLGAPPTDFIGLNSTSCLATGIVGLGGFLGARGQVRMLANTAEEQGALLNRMAAGGIAVRMTHYIRNTTRATDIKDVIVRLPFALDE